MKNRLAVFGLAAGLLGGGVAGVALGVSGIAGAQTGSSSTTTPPAATTPAPGGSFHSNEDAAHEAGESAADEAAEDSGHGRHGRCHHREGADDDHDRSPASPTTTAPPT